MTAKKKIAHKRLTLLHLAERLLLTPSDDKRGGLYRHHMDVLT